MLTAPAASADTTGRSANGADGPGPPGPVYAGLVTRAIAITFDALVIVVVDLVVAGAALLIFAVFAISGKHHTVAVIIGGVASLAWLIGYFVVFWTTTGQTPGSRVMHIRVVRTDGSRMHPRQALIRLGAMVVSLPLFWGYVPILTSPRRRAVPDTLAGTVVVLAEGSDQPLAQRG
jgi:uncharacterized RDD family membrane protein YckC